MGMTNRRYGLETKIAHFRGELEQARDEVKRIETGVALLSSLHQRITQLEAVIASAEHVIQHDDPDWQPAKIKGVRARQWKSPFKSGEIGRTSLTVMREAGKWCARAR